MVKDNDQINASIWIAAKPELVWRAVETQDLIRKWLASSVEIEPRLGGSFKIFGKDDKGTVYLMGGEVVAWEPGRLFQVTWEQYEPHPHPPTLLTLELAEEGEGTRVTLTHNQFDTTELYLSFKQGWGDPTKTLKKIEAIVVSSLEA